MPPSKCGLLTQTGAGDVAESISLLHSCLQDDSYQSWLVRRLLSEVGWLAEASREMPAKSPVSFVG